MFDKRHFTILLIPFLCQTTLSDRSASPSPTEKLFDPAEYKSNFVHEFLDQIGLSWRLKTAREKAIEVVSQVQFVKNFPENKISKLTREQQKACKNQQGLSRSRFNELYLIKNPCELKPVFEGFSEKNLVTQDWGNYENFADNLVNFVNGQLNKRYESIERLLGLVDVDESDLESRWESKDPEKYKFCDKNNLENKKAAKENANDPNWEPDFYPCSTEYDRDNFPFTSVYEDSFQMKDSKGVYKVEDTLEFTQNNSYIFKPVPIFLMEPKRVARHSRKFNYYFLENAIEMCGEFCHDDAGNVDIMKLDRGDMQYFIDDKTGITRYFPGFKVDQEGEERSARFLSSFDPRMRPWYRKSMTTGGKRILIMLNLSGSMTGDQWNIAEYLLIKLMGQLEEKDLFNILAFNDNIHFVEDTFSKRLYPMNNVNKKKMIFGLSNVLTPSGMTNTSNAFMAASDLITDLDNVDIIVVSDGYIRTDHGSNVWKALNLNKTEVTISNFICGQVPTDVDESCEVSREWNGFHKQFNTTQAGEVQSHIRDFFTWMHARGYGKDHSYDDEVEGDRSAKPVSSKPKWGGPFIETSHMNTQKYHQPDDLKLILTAKTTIPNLFQEADAKLQLTRSKRGINHVEKDTVMNEPLELNDGEKFLTYEQQEKLWSDLDKDESDRNGLIGINFSLKYISKKFKEMTKRFPPESAYFFMYNNVDNKLVWHPRLRLNHQFVYKFSGRHYPDNYFMAEMFDSKVEVVEPKIAEFLSSGKSEGTVDDHEVYAKSGAWKKTSVVYFSSRNIENTDFSIVTVFDKSRKEFPVEVIEALDDNYEDMFEQDQNATDSLMRSVTSQLYDFEKIVRSTPGHFKRTEHDEEKKINMDSPLFSMSTQLFNNDQSNYWNTATHSDEWRAPSVIQNDFWHSYDVANSVLIEHLDYSQETENIENGGRLVMYGGVEVFGQPVGMIGYWAYKSDFFLNQTADSYVVDSNGLILNYKNENGVSENEMGKMGEEFWSALQETAPTDINVVADKRLEKQGACRRIRGDDGFNITTDQTDIIKDSFVPDHLSIYAPCEDTSSEECDEEQHPLAIYHEFLAPDESGYFYYICEYIRTFLSIDFPRSEKTKTQPISIHNLNLAPISYGEVKRRVVYPKNKENPEMKSVPIVEIAEITDKPSNLIEINNISGFKDRNTDVNETMTSVKELEEASEITDPEEKIRLWKSAYRLNSEFSNDKNISSEDYESYFQVETRLTAEDIDIKACTSKEAVDDEQIDKFLLRCRGWDAYCANPGRMVSGMLKTSSSAENVFGTLHSCLFLAIAMVLVF